MVVVRGKKSGKIVGFKVSAAEYAELDSSGLCLGCGDEVHGLEPDARGVICRRCHEPKVYGAEELVLMGRLVLRNAA